MSNQESWLYLQHLPNGYTRISNEHGPWTTAHEMTGESGHLIAAAPTLLSLLRECSAALSDLLLSADVSGLECQEQWACIAECNRAIASAEGRDEHPIWGLAQDLCVNPDLNTEGRGE